jgi:hypothetical protein
VRLLGFDPATASQVSRPVAVCPTNLNSAFRLRRSGTTETSLVSNLVTGHTCKRPSPNGKGPLSCYFVVAGAGFKQHFIADGDHVVVLTRTTADGQSADQADVLTFRGGKVAKFQSAGDTALQESIWGKK